MLDIKEQITLTMKLKLIRNRAMLKVTNNTHDTVTFNPADMLDDSDERKCMSDKEILDKYIDLENSCLSRWEKKEVINLIYEYKDAFSLRDKIGTCPQY